MKSSSTQGSPNKSFQTASKQPGVKGEPAPKIGGKMHKGDSRSKSMMRNIKPQKGC